MATTHTRSQRWIGKALGFSGALIAAPAEPGLLLWWLAAGLSLGHMLDTLTTPARRRRSGSGLRRASSSPASLRFTFAALGRIAACGDASDPAHRRQAEQLMNRLGFTPERRHEALVWFDSGHDPAFPFHSVAAACATEFRAHPVLKDLTLDSFCRMAGRAGSDSAMAQLLELGGLLGWSADLLRARTHAAAPPPPAATSATARACQVLGVRPDDNEATIRLAYRRLVSHWHPDRLPADANHDQRAAAQRRMCELRDALDVLLTGPRPTP